MSVIDRSSAEHYLWQVDCDGWRFIDREDLSVNAERMPEGRSEKRHYHERARQIIYVLSGGLTIDLGGVIHRLGPGQALPIPPGRRHQMVNEGPGVAEYLVISSPAARNDRIDVTPE